ncbi:hypothetical protein ACFVYR_34975 [Streptomyces sp. NPDC058284]|uniref:hypothetical protein n=1 Tax=unclassified Streptomyces TaxID=2593676 RepID=UPI0036564C93
MAVEIPVVAFTRAGTAMPSAVVGDPTADHTLPNDGRVGLMVKNTSASVVGNVTINLSRMVDGQPVTPRVIPVPVSTTLALGPFAPGDYGADVGIGVDAASLTLVAVRVS